LFNHRIKPGKIATPTTADTTRAPIDIAGEPFATI
jgi:hypothetical protein